MKNKEQKKEMEEANKEWLESFIKIISWRGWGNERVNKEKENNNNEEN